MDQLNRLSSFQDRHESRARSRIEINAFGSVNEIWVYVERYLGFIRLEVSAQVSVKGDVLLWFKYANAEI